MRPKQRRLVTDGASIADVSESAEDCGCASGALGDFIGQTSKVWDQFPSQAHAALLGIAIGVMAERHRIHRERHDDPEQPPAA